MLGRRTAAYRLRQYADNPRKEKGVKVFQVQFYEGSNTYIDGSIENVLAAIAVEMKENEVDTKITITTKEMSQTEIDALPEWVGP